MDFRGKRILVMGLGKSGLGALRLLRHLGAEVMLYDDREIGDPEMLDLVRRVGASILERSEASEGGTAFDLAVLSPGIRRDHPLVRSLSTRGVKVVGELELGYIVTIPYRIPWLAVTGTNGKSTTTRLLELMLKREPRKVIAGGNIGDAITLEILTVMEEGWLPECRAVVAEVSSFQLETIDRFRPVTGAVLNITPDHMDRYETFEDYAETKLRIAMNQGVSDHLVINLDDPVLVPLTRDLASMKIGFSSGSPVGEAEPDATLRKGWLAFRDGEGWIELIREDDLLIRGKHNVENCLAAGLMARTAGVGWDAVRETLAEFRGLPHRMEYLGEYGGVGFYNDSKGTNPAAVMKSVEGFDHGLILILGGRDKDGDFRPLRRFLGCPVKKVILLGEAREKIHRHLGSPTDAVLVDGMKEAVDEAVRTSIPGDTVLLSPGCASFDQYGNFEERGEDFKRTVMGYMERIHG